MENGGGREDRQDKELKGFLCERRDPESFSSVFCSRRDYLYLCNRKRMKVEGNKAPLFVLIKFVYDRKE